MRKFLLAFLPMILLILQGYSQAGMPYTPDFSLSPDDFTRQVLEPKSEIWVLDFWASWCGPCIEAAPYLKSIQKKYSEKGVRFISLSWDDSDERWYWALDRLKMSWQQLRVTAALKPYVEAHFPHKGIPAAFVVRTDGKLKRVAGIGMLETTIQRALRAASK